MVITKFYFAENEGDKNLYKLYTLHVCIKRHVCKNQYYPITTDVR